MRNNILIIGYGSIGRRHGQVLNYLGNEIAFVRTGKSTIKDDDFLKDKEIFYDLKKAVKEKNPMYVVDCSPTSFHFSNLCKLYELKVNALVEKPLIINYKKEVEIKKLHEIANSKSLKYGISFQYRFHPIIKKLRDTFKSLKEKQIIKGNIIWTEYLPEWHPWEDYKNSYAAKVNLGGGSLLTMCHPFDYLNYIIGENNFCVKKLYNGRLDINVDQSSLILCESNLTINPIEIYVDFDSKIRRHSINLEGKDWSLYANLVDNVIEFKSHNNNSFKINFGNLNRNLLFQGLHEEYQEWIRDNKQFRNKLSTNIKLIEFLSSKQK